MTAHGVHPESEPIDRLGTVGQAVESRPLAVDTLGGRFHVEWDAQAPVTPLGQLVFFAQFLAAGGLYGDWVRTCPLRFTSPNAPQLTDRLGTIMLAILAGQNRYAHVTGLRADTVNPQGLGMNKVCSEDSVRRAFTEADPRACAAWQTGALQQAWLPALRHAWILDLDVTVKPIYGRQQEGAEVGYNPHKPGRPSHAYHTLFVRHLRLVLDVEVRPGKQHAAKHSRPKRGLGVQLVEPVCTLCRTGATARGDHEPTAVVKCGGTDDPEWAAGGAAVDQHPCGGSAGAGDIEPIESVSQRAAQYCGAVGRSKPVGTDLGSELEPMVAPTRAVARARWVNSGARHGI